MLRGKGVRLYAVIMQAILKVCVGDTVGYGVIYGHTLLCS